MRLNILPQHIYKVKCQYTFFYKFMIKKSAFYTKVLLLGNVPEINCIFPLTNCKNKLVLYIIVVFCVKIFRRHKKYILKCCSVCEYVKKGLHSPRFITYCFYIIFQCTVINLQPFNKFIIIRYGLSWQIFSPLPTS